MSQFQHKNLSPGNIHGIVNWEVVDIAARDALLVTGEDVGKVVKVGFNNLYWLAGVAPVTWTVIEGSPETRNVKTYRIALTFDSDGTTTIGDPLPTNATVSKVLVNVTQAFNSPTATVSFGVTGQLAELGATTESDLATVGIYVIGCFKTYASNEQLLATYVAGGATAGAAAVEVHYSIV